MSISANPRLVEFIRVWTLVRSGRFCKALRTASGSKWCGKWFQANFLQNRTNTINTSVTLYSFRSDMYSGVDVPCNDIFFRFDNMKWVLMLCAGITANPGLAGLVRSGRFFKALRTKSFVIGEQVCGEWFQANVLQNRTNSIPTSLTI